jgi:hypothetical protein
METAMGGIQRRAILSVSKSATFFLRPGRTPIPRGTAISFDEKSGLVYLSGYIPFLRCHPGIRPPQSVEIAVNRGTLTFQESASDLLRLTKMDWSTCAFCTEFPRTLEISRQAQEFFRSSGQEDLVVDDRFCL